MKTIRSLVAGKGGAIYAHIQAGAFLIGLIVAGAPNAQDLSKLVGDLRRQVATRPAERIKVPAQEPAAPLLERPNLNRPPEGAPVANSSGATSEAGSLSSERELASTPGGSQQQIKPVPGLYTVQLGRAEELLAKQALIQQLGASRAGSQLATFPGIVRHVDPDLESLDLKLYALAGGPLKLLTNTGEFVGSLKIGVATLGLPGLHKLTTPLTFQVLDDGIADPDHVSIDQTSPPFATIKIKTSEVHDPFVVRVASQSTPEGIPVTFKVSPTLFLKTDRKVIQGFGLETAHVSIYTIGLPNPNGTRVNIETDPSAHVADPELELDAKGDAHTIVRSDSTGTVTITASTAGFADVTNKIVFAPPWRTLVASLLGGLMGGFVHIGSVYRREEHKRIIGRMLLTSAVVGLLVFGLTVLGVNVLPVDFAVRVGDVFVLIVSALGGYWGPAAVKSLLPATAGTT